MVKKKITCIEVLREFIADIEAANPEDVAEEWPDIVRTYNKAKKVVKDKDAVKHPYGL